MNTSDSSDLFHVVVDRLSRLAHPSKFTNIGMDSEIYADLGLYGDDLFEFFCWLKSEYGLSMKFGLLEYAPSESNSLSLFKLYRMFFKNKTTFKSLKVRDVILEIQNYQAKNKFI